MKTRLKFSKIGTMKFVGHLDILRFFQKTFRRSNIEIAYSKGFHPHQEISFALPLGIGLTSEGEYADVELISYESEKKMIEKFNKNSNKEIYLTSWKKVPEENKTAMSLVTAADYAVFIKESPFSNEIIKEKFLSFFQQEEIKVKKKTKKKEIEINICPFLYQYAFTEEEFLKKGGTACLQESQYPFTLYLQLGAGSVNHLKPEYIIKAFCENFHIEYKPHHYQIHRIEMYTDDLKEIQKKISLNALGEEL